LSITKFYEDADINLTLWKK